MTDKVNKYLGSDIMNEAVGKFNIGFEEMVNFYNVANPQEIKKMERIIKNNDWLKFKNLIKKVLGIELM